MKSSDCYLIFYLIFFDIWDLSSQNASYESKKQNTVTEVYVTSWEGHVTLTASNSSSHKAITHTLFTTTWSQNTPIPTSAPCSQSHVGSFLGGMLLGLIITLVGCLGYRLIYSCQQGRYRALEQHDTII